MSLDLTTFSSSSARGFRGPGQMELWTGARTVVGGAGGVGSRISGTAIQKLAGAMRPYFQVQNSVVPLITSDGKETMRSLNDRLAEYMAKVRTLEESNSVLEAQIKEALTKKCAASPRDWDAYEKTLEGLKEQLTDLTMDNSRLMLHIDNARLAADDFRVKFETENAVRQAVEADITNLRKMTDNTTLNRLQLEGQLEALREELEFLHKNHEEDKENVRGQVNASNVDVQMDAPKGDDLNETITNIRRQYENAVQKNREDSEVWFNTKVENLSAEMVRTTETLQVDRSQLNDLRRQQQVLEIDLEALRSMNHSLEDTLRETGERYAREVTLHNTTIKQLEAELGELRAQMTNQRLEYQALLSIKTKLQEEINAYQGLLEGSGMADGGGTHWGTSAHEGVKDKGAGARDHPKINDADARDDIKDKGAGARDHPKINGADARDDIKDKGDDTKINGAGAREDTKDKGMVAYEDIKDTSLPENYDDSVEFSLEQALNAVPAACPGVVPERDEKSEETAEDLVVPQCDQELSASIPATTEKLGEEPKEEPADRKEKEEEEEPSNRSLEVDVGGEVQEKQVEMQQEEEEPAKTEVESSQSEEQLEE
ncbi:keratin, type I cytoskeletal 18-like [Brachyhypopomus gauderio]|uniref:keratin, type I cytoskeletal 18-like n=1 Tax=Brachyhypopomus gauderio TaxID=698409 RepID=UPI0040428733